MNRLNLWLPVCLLCALGIASLWLDIPVARFAREGRVPGTVKEIFENLEPFGHGAGVVVIALVVFCLESGRRLRNTAGILLAAFGSGLAANLLKLIVHRDRPWQLADGVAHGIDTFGGFLTSPGGSHGSQSFPSAHAATAMGLAVALACYYPRGRAAFVTMAAATAISRVIAPSHFVSDTLIGLALGLAIGQIVVRSPRFAPELSGREPTSDESTGLSNSQNNASQRAAA